MLQASKSVVYRPFVIGSINTGGLLGFSLRTFTAFLSPFRKLDCKGSPFFNVLHKAKAHFAKFGTKGRLTLHNSSNDHGSGSVAGKYRAFISFVVLFATCSKPGAMIWPKQSIFSLKTESFYNSIVIPALFSGLSSSPICHRCSFC